MPALPATPSPLPMPAPLTLDAASRPGGQEAGVDVPGACLPGNPLSAAALRPNRTDDDARDVLDFLCARHSVAPRHLQAPGPDLAALQQALALAARAPDHRGLRPWRFVLVPPARRQALGDLFAADAAQRGHGAEEVERARERALRGPVLLALVVRAHQEINDVPVHEQWLTAGAALMNFLNALHLQGYAAKVLSGTSVRAVEIQARFCGPGEQLVAWIAAGTAHRRTPGRGPAADLGLGLGVWEDAARSD
jgi:nitroreductase